MVSKIGEQCSNQAGVMSPHFPLVEMLRYSCVPVLRQE